MLKMTDKWTQKLQPFTRALVFSIQSTVINITDAQISFLRLLPERLELLHIDVISCYETIYILNKIVV